MDADQLTPELAQDAPRHSMQRLVVHLDLVSGIGGFALAAQMAGGIKTAAFCEIDPWARQVLAKNFPGTPIHDDVRTLKPNDYGRIDLITGGYPCQPFSLAGKRQGEDDDRHLWPEVLRIVKQARPRWVLCENVIGHVTMGLDEVLSDLEGAGYSAEPIIIPACAVDADHQRYRVWIIAHDSRISLEKQQMDKAAKELSELGGATDEGWIRVATRKKNEYRMDGMPHGLSQFVDRARGLGNAIYPPLAAEILRCMMRVHSLHNAESIHPESKP
jgi:DNA (cytosine-5)-methyltransferase 1